MFFIWAASSLGEREREYFPSLSILTSREVQHDSRFTPRRVVSLLGVTLRPLSRPLFRGSSKEEKSFRVTGTWTLIHERMRVDIIKLVRWYGANQFSRIVSTKILGPGASERLRFLYEYRTPIRSCS